MQLCGVIDLKTKQKNQQPSWLKVLKTMGNIQGFQQRTRVHRCARTEGRDGRRLVADDLGTRGGNYRDGYRSGRTGKSIITFVIIIIIITIIISKTGD